jgi:hypothetical protein
MQETETSHKPASVQKRLDHCKLHLEKELDNASQRLFQTPKGQLNYLDFGKFAPNASRANVKDRMSPILEERSPSNRSPVGKQRPCWLKRCPELSQKQLRSRRTMVARGAAWIAGCVKDDESLVDKFRKK